MMVGRRAGGRYKLVGGAAAFGGGGVGPILVTKQQKVEDFAVVCCPLEAHTCGYVVVCCVDTQSVSSSPSPLASDGRTDKLYERMNRREKERKAFLYVRVGLAQKAFTYILPRLQMEINTLVEPRV